MQIDYSAFILPHVGDSISQCADRFSCGIANHCFAIADGVGNSLFPGEWASLLCEDYISHPNDFSADSKLKREEELISQWEHLRDEHVSNLTDNEKFIYEMGLDKADFAACTFVGLFLDDYGWKCLAIGDSYFFVIDKEYNIIDKVASMIGRDFDNFPEYFASKKGNNNGEVVEESGTYENVAYLALMTDALSDWFIEANNEERKELIGIRTHDVFADFVDKRRQQMSLKDDDTTMVILQLKNDNNDDIVYNKNHIDKIDDLLSEEIFNIEKETKLHMDVEVVEAEKEKAPSSIIANNDFILSAVGKIEKEYHDYTKNKMKSTIKKLIGFIKQLTHGTSD